MTEGINMGRKSPWVKEEYISVYNHVSNYASNLAAQFLQENDANSAAEAITAYNFYKCPAIYLFVHYHYGMFEDLEMNNTETTIYLTMFLPNVLQFARELKKAFSTGQVFVNNNSLNSKLMAMCDEIIYIEENF